MELSSNTKVKFSLVKTNCNTHLKSTFQGELLLHYQLHAKSSTHALLSGKQTTYPDQHDKIDMSTQINHTVHTIHALVPQVTSSILSETKSRTRRGLFDFIGSISKSLFGTATVDDVRNLARHINVIAKHNNKLAAAMAKHDEMLTSYMTQTDKRFENVIDAVKTNFEAIENSTNQINRDIKTYQLINLKLTEYLVQEMNSSAIMNKHLEELTLSVHELLKGKLSPFLLSPHDLKKTIHQIQTILDTKIQRISSYTHRSRILLFISEFVFARNHSKLYISVKFPVSSSTAPFQLYRVISKPVPINETSKHATQLIDTFDYFVQSADNQHFAVTDNQKLSKCTGQNIQSCSFHLPLTSTASPTCISALFYNQKEQIHKLCDFRFLIDTLKPDIHELSSSSILVYRTNTIALDCPSGQKIMKGCSFCIVRIPCMCSVSADFLYLPPRLGKCQNHSDSITTLHPVNLALIQHFFSPETYNSSMGDTTFAQPIDLTIPNFHIYNHTFSNILAQDKQYHLSLKRMAQAASKEETIFTSLSEPWVDGEQPVSSDWPDLNGIISIAALGLSALLALVCLVLFRRLQTLTTAFLLLQKATPIHGLSLASPMPTFHYVNTHQSTTEDTNSYLFNTQCNPWPFATLSIITTATLALFIIYIWKKFQQTQGTKILIEITNGITCITIPLMSLPLCPSDWHITPPTDITDMHITGSFQPFMHAQLLGLQIINIHTKHHILIASNISVNIFTARKLRTMFNQPFHCYLLLAHNQYFQIIR
ncbi:unnamed protein product [Mytilus coruscus]|uniref:Envelope fusion protein n=1 Tax=Mytilus coruscus TaxID=42192 RepID=A0A6J8AJE1_MYTCO|nr:unnamed protein product [Mytilus coruscus]